MNKKVPVQTDQAPAPIGPYNQAIMVGDFLFISGQIAIDPASGELKIDDLEEETHLVMRNLGAVLATQGLTHDHIVKTSIGDGHVAVPPSAVGLVVDRQLRLLWAAGVVAWGDVSEAA